MSEKKEKKPFWETKFGGIVKGIVKAGGDVNNVVELVKERKFGQAFQAARNAIRGVKGEQADQIELKMSVEEKEILRELNDFEIQMETLQIEREKQISTRWVSDNLNGNKMAKAARPASLFWMMALITAVVVVKLSGGTELPDPYLYLIGTLAATIFGGYFALRQIGKRNDAKYGIKLPEN